jgi:hypothetical protein
VRQVIHAQAVDDVGLVPADQLQHHLHLLLITHRRHAEHVLDVDYAEAPDLHVVLDQLRGAPDQQSRGDSPHLHQVVGHQPKTTHDQLQRRFRLADAALAQQQHPHPQHVHQHTVQAQRGSQRVLHEPLDPIDHHR